MRSKKFLEAATYLPASMGSIGSKIVVDDLTSSLNNYEDMNLNAELRRQSDPGANPSSSSTSMLGYLKNSTSFNMSLRSPSSTTSNLSNTNTASSSGAPARADIPSGLVQSGSKRLSEVLLVQDPTVFLLVRPTSSIGASASLCVRVCV